jgi:SRSO17 transposase
MPKVSNIFKCAGERDSSALLPDRQGDEEDGNQAILAPRQPIGRMTGDL